MTYADSLLSTGERVIHRDRQHWMVLAWGAKLPILSIVAALLLLVLIGDLTGVVRDMLWGVVAVLFVGGVAFLAWATLRYLNQEYVITNRRVMQVEGVVNKRATDSSLEKINDAALSQSLFGRIFGFGDLDILTAAEQGIERFRMIVDPIGFKRSMLDAKHEYEVGMERAGWQPNAAGGADPGQAPTPMASAEAPGSKSNPDDVTRTLASLADLRDRGAISPEEYEAKKTDLLSRL